MQQKEAPAAGSFAPAHRRAPPLGPATTASQPGPAVSTQAAVSHTHPSIALLMAQLGQPGAALSCSFPGTALTSPPLSSAPTQTTGMSSRNSLDTPSSQGGRSLATLPSGSLPATRLEGPTRSNAFDLNELDPEKARKILANRQSARKSREKKAMYLNTLQSDIVNISQQALTVRTETERLLEQRNQALEQHEALQRTVTDFAAQIAAFGVTPNLPQPPLSHTTHPPTQPDTQPDTQTASAHSMDHPQQQSTTPGLPISPLSIPPLSTVSPYSLTDIDQLPAPLPIPAPVTSMAPPAVHSAGSLVASGAQACGLAGTAGLTSIMPRGVTADAATHATGVAAGAARPSVHRRSASGDGAGPHEPRNVKRNVTFTAPCSAGVRPTGAGLRSLTDIALSRAGSNAAKRTSDSSDVSSLVGQGSGSTEDAHVCRERQRRRTPTGLSQSHTTAACTVCHSLAGQDIPEWPHMAPTGVNSAHPIATSNDGRTMQQGHAEGQLGATHAGMGSAQGFILGRWHGTVAMPDTCTGMGTASTSLHVGEGYLDMQLQPSEMRKAWGTTSTNQQASAAGLPQRTLVRNTSRMSPARTAAGITTTHKANSIMDSTHPNPPPTQQLPETAQLPAQALFAAMASAGMDAGAPPVLHVEHSLGAATQGVGHAQGYGASAHAAEPGSSELVPNRHPGALAASGAGPHGGVGQIGLLGADGAGPSVLLDSCEDALHKALDRAVVGMGCINEETDAQESPDKMSWVWDAEGLGSGTNSGSRMGSGLSGLPPLHPTSADRMASPLASGLLPVLELEGTRHASGPRSITTESVEHDVEKLSASLAQLSHDHSQHLPDVPTDSRLPSSGQASGSPDSHTLLNMLLAGRSSGGGSGAAGGLLQSPPGSSGGGSRRGLFVPRPSQPAPVVGASQLGRRVGSSTGMAARPAEQLLPHATEGPAEPMSGPLIPDDELVQLLLKPTDD